MALLATDPTTPTTLLEAVNNLLRAIGRTPVTSLATVDMDERAQDARELILGVNKEVQEQGWHFNSRYDYALEPNVQGNIVLPGNTVSFAPSGRSVHRDITMVGAMLYDKETNTDLFDGTVWANLILLFEYGDVPSPIRSYVFHLAGQRFVADRQPDSRTSRFAEAEVAKKLSVALQFDSDAHASTLVQSSPHFQRFGRR